MRIVDLSRHALAALVVAATAAGPVETRQGAERVGPDDTLVYVGTYTGPKTASQGIYAFKLQAAAGGQADATLIPLGLAAETASPSFIEIDRGRGLLFAVNEVDQYEGKPTGTVSAFSIDRATGRLTLINRQPSLGRAPCHLVLDKTGRFLLVANYSSGTVAVLPVAADGTLGEPTMVQHTGSSVNPQRQQGPHAHCTTFDPAYRFVFVCDLGIDKVMAYRLDAAKGVLAPHTPPFAGVTPGGGPRHMAFRPDGRFAYVNNEMTSSVTAFGYDANTGVLTSLQTLSSLPPGYEGSNSGAELAMHPSGRFLYASNRGHDSVALFNVDQAKGTLTFVEAQPSGGRTPRHFEIDPAAKHLAIANQASNSVFVCQIDAATGRLACPKTSTTVPSPVCVKFLPPKG